MRKAHPSITSRWPHLIAILLFWHGARCGVDAALVWTAENSATSNTLALYHFNGDANDANGTYNGTLVNQTGNQQFVTEGTGHWLSTGSGTYIESHYGASNAGDFMNTLSVSGVNWDNGLTVSFWYRVRGAIGSANPLFWIEGPNVSGTLSPRVSINTDQYGTNGNGRLAGNIRDGSPSNVTNLINYGPNLEWKHLALVYDPSGSNGAGSNDGGTWQFYVDNVAAGSAITLSTDLSGVSSFNFRFMSNYYNDNGIDADFDELLIENDVITDFSQPVGFAIPEPSAGWIVMSAGLLTLILRRRARKPVRPEA